MRRTAFTLMELLIVVSIIMILMGMLFVGLRIGKEQANKAKTTSAIATLQAELANYKQVNGKYPEDNVVYATVFTGKKYDEISKSEWESVNRQVMVDLKTAGASLPDVLKDGWGEPLHYRPAKFLPYTAGAPRVIDGDDPPGRDSYQIWSTGTDKKDDGGAKLPANDDVTSWEKK